MNIKDVLLAQIDRSTSVAFNKQINLKSHFFLIYKIEALMHFLLTFQSMSSIIYSPYVLLLSPDNEMCSVFFKTNDLTKKQIKNYCFTPFFLISLLFVVKFFERTAAAASISSSILYFLTYRLLHSLLSLLLFTKFVSTMVTNDFQISSSVEIFSC